MARGQIVRHPQELRKVIPESVVKAASQGRAVLLLDEAISGDAGAHFHR
jgi:hypothetical protein